MNIEKDIFCEQIEGQPDVQHDVPYIVDNDCVSVYQSGSIPIPLLNQWFIIRERFSIWLSKNPRVCWLTLLGTSITLYAMFLGFAINHDIDSAVGLISVAAVVCAVIAYVIIRDKFGRSIYGNILLPLRARFLWIIKKTTWLLIPLVLIGLSLYLILAVITERGQLQSCLGLVVFSVVPLISSKYPDDIKWTPVIWGISMQFAMGLLILQWRTGYDVIKFIGDASVEFLEFSLAGAAAMFGNPWFFLHPFPMFVLPLITFIGAWTFTATHYGLTEIFVRKFGYVVRISLHTTAIESVSLVANFFLSVLDSILLFRDYLPTLTRSEFFTFLVGAHSSIAGFAFMLFVWFGASPQHLLTASIMSAPAAVAISKLNYPETEELQSQKLRKDKLGETYPTVLHAISAGAIEAAKGTIALMIQVLAFVSLVEFADTVLGWFASKVDVKLSFRIVFGKLFKPVAWLLGVQWSECETVGELIGTKVFINEILAFLDLGSVTSKNALSPRAEAIATYALSGFSSFGTLYMFVGVWRSIAPNKTKLAISLIPRILMCTNLACFMTACIAGIFYDEEKLEGVDPVTSSGFALTMMNSLPGISELMNLL